MFGKKCPTKFRTLKTEKKTTTTSNVLKQEDQHEGIFTIKDLFPE